MKSCRDTLTIKGDQMSHDVLRNITEEVLHKVIKATKVHRICALGTPGVGKTTTTCIFIWLLLEQKKTVVYQICGINEMVLFTCLLRHRMHQVELM